MPIFTSIPIQICTKANGLHPNGRILHSATPMIPENVVCGFKSLSGLRGHVTCEIEVGGRVFVITSPARTGENNEKKPRLTDNRLFPD
jgi:hypothetical protein